MAASPSHPSSSNLSVALLRAVLAHPDPVLQAIRFQQTARRWRARLRRLEVLIVLSVVGCAILALPLAFHERQWVEDWQEAREVQANASLVGQAQLVRLRGLEAARKQAEQERPRREEELARRRQALARLRAERARRREELARFQAEQQRRQQESEEIRALDAEVCPYTGPRGR